MKVIHIGKYYYPYSRGIETYLKNLCERLIEAVDLEVIVANDCAKTVHEEINGVRVTRLGRLFELASTSFCFQLPFILRRKKPDIVHIHLPNPWAELCYFLAGCPGKLIVSFHSDIIRQKFLLQLHKPLHKAFLKRAEKIIIATPRHAEFSPFLSKLPKEKIEVIHYGIDPKDIQNYDDNIKEEIIQKTGKPLVLFVGSLVYYKGLEILLQSVNPLLSKIPNIPSGRGVGAERTGCVKKSPSPTPDVKPGCSTLKNGELKNSPPYEGGVPEGRGGSIPPLKAKTGECRWGPARAGDVTHFLLIGTGPLKNKLKIMAKDLEIEKYVHFFGEVNDETLKAAYNACDIFCLPSNYRSEAFGIVQLEAFAAGKPVISCNLPSGVPYVNQDGKTGIIVPPNDPSALADAINKLLNNDELREKLGKQALERVTQEFTADKMAVKTLGVYEEVV